MVQLFPEVHKYYNASKVLTEEFYLFDGKKYGPHIKYSSNGKPSVIMNYEADVLDGECTEFGENGEIEGQCTCKNGKLHGEFFVNDPTNNQIYRETYRDDVKHGPYVRWRKFPDILWETCTYYEGLKEGTLVYYDNNGVKVKSKAYHKDRLNGEFVEFHSNGYPSFVQYYVDGLQTGKWYRYDSTGNMTESNDGTPGSL